MLSYILSGLSTVLNPLTLLQMFFGSAVGIVFGAVPGLSVVMALVLLLPFTYTMAPGVGIAFLISVYIGATSGGLISAILLNIPGTPNSVATTFDGVPMRNQGKAYKALGLGIVFSCIGTIFSCIALMLISPLLAKIAIKFGPHEYFSVALFSIILVSSMAGRDLCKAFFAAFLGIAFSTIGLSPVDAVKRFTFGSPELIGGFSTLPMLIGLFAIKEILETSENIKFTKKEDVKVYEVEKAKGFGFSMKEFLEQKWNFLVSAVVGVVIGIIPGIGGSSSNLIAYDIIKNRSKDPDSFGKGNPAGIVASETSNNASIGGALIPLLTLGIPGDGATAVLLGALMIHGISPGPLLFQNQGDLVYTIFMAVIVGSIIMLILEFLGLKLFVKILKVPPYILLPTVLMFTTVGAYALSNRMFDVFAILIFGLLGYMLYKFKIPTPPFIIGFILGGMLEENLRRGLILSNDSFNEFVTKPISGMFLGFTLVYLVYIFIKKHKETKKQEEWVKEQYEN